MSAFQHGYNPCEAASSSSRRAKHRAIVVDNSAFASHIPPTPVLQPPRPHLARLLTPLAAIFQPPYIRLGVNPDSKELGTCGLKLYDD